MRVLTAGFETRNGDEVLSGGTSFPANTLLGGYCASGSSPIVVSLPNLTEFFVSFAYNLIAQGQYDRFNILDSAGTVVAALNWGNGTTLKAYRKDGSTNVLLGESPVLMKEGWNIFEVHFTYASGGGVFEVRRDGTSILTNNLDNKTKPDSAESNLAKLEWITAQSQNFQLDDIAINDTTGADNSWPGYNHIIGLVPNTNGDSSGFVGSDGNSTNNYQLVDDRPADTSDYVESDLVNTKDLYNVSDLSLSANDVIKRVWVGARARVANTDGGNGLKLGVKSGGQEHFDTNPQILGIDWAYYRSEDMTTDPNGQAWDQTKINALQIGMVVS